MNLSVSERRRLMSLQLKKLDESMKGALADFMADWKDEEIIPSTLQKYTGF